jgi:CHAD domain-containing protein
MISKAKLSSYFLKKCSNITDSLLRFCETRDHEEIHKLRVEFKKIKAQVSLVKECNKNSIIPRELESAKIVYRRAGVVRDAYIAHQHQSLIAPGISVKDDNFLTHASNDFCKKEQLHLSVLNDWKFTVCGQFENVGNACAISFYRKWLSSLSEKFISIEEEELHECRKIIKRLMYLYPLMSEQIRQSLRINIAYLDSLQEEIGKWHDTIIAREHYSGSEQKDEKHLRKISLAGEARLKSIQLLTTNFPEKFAG